MKRINAMVEILLCTALAVGWVSLAVAGEQRQTPVKAYEGQIKSIKIDKCGLQLGTCEGSIVLAQTLPILAAGAVVGSINLYAASTDAFVGHHQAIARIFDAWAPGAVTNADLSFSTRAIAEQAPRKLQQDLDVQVAVGILAAARGIGWGEALDELQDAARRAGVSEADLAASVIEIDRHHGMD